MHISSNCQDSVSRQWTVTIALRTPGQLIESFVRRSSVLKLLDLAVGQWLFLHSCHNCYILFFSPQRVKYLIIRFHWDTFFLLGNRKPWHGFDWVVVLEFCCECRHLGTYFFVYPFILCIVRHSEDKLILTIAACRKWEDSETCLFSLRQQLQHSTNQLAKETNELLKELGSLPLPLSTSEQVGIFWFLVLCFNKKGFVLMEIQCVKQK